MSKKPYTVTMLNAFHITLYLHRYFIVNGLKQTLIVNQSYTVISSL